MPEHRLIARLLRLGCDHDVDPFVAQPRIGTHFVTRAAPHRAGSRETSIAQGDDLEFAGKRIVSRKQLSPQVEIDRRANRMTVRLFGAFRIVEYADNRPTRHRAGIVIDQGAQEPGRIARSATARIILSIRKDNRSSARQTQQILCAIDGGVG